MYDENEQEPIVSPDTDNATHFHYTEAPIEHQAKFKRFHGYNSGIYNGSWADETKIRRLDNLNLFDAIANWLDLTRYQHRHGRELFDELPLKQLGYRAEIVAFCVCIVVARADDRYYHPQRSDAHNDRLFDDVAKTFSEGPDRITACLNRVQERLA